MRAAVLQILPNERLEALKARQFKSVINLQSRRGAIVDRNGRELALSTKVVSVYADPAILKSKKEASQKLAPLLGISRKELFEKFKDSKKRFTWIARQVSPETGEAVRKLNLRGIQVVDEFKRIYPNEDLLGSTLGFVGAEGHGLEGLEHQLNELLAGDKRKVMIRKDARGRPLVHDGLMFTESLEGAEVQLTVDGDLQYKLEQELKNAVSEHQAEAAYGVILDAQTSAVLAVSSLPGFDPNNPSKAAENARKNKAFTDAFEPGSTMKTFVVAAALKAGITAPNTNYNTENGTLKIGNRIIREAEKDHKWKNLSVSEILSLSSNIGTTKIAFDLGPQLLREELSHFGFGTRSGVGFPGESPGALLPLPWNQHLLSNVSFGHGMTATPLQIANAYASIANGGTLNMPFIVRSFRDMTSGKIIETQPQKVRTVLEPAVAQNLRMILAGVTAPGGTGYNAKVDGYVVAGKTGTAQKVDFKKGGYLKGAYLSSFVGFIPANDPRFVIFIAVDHPKKNSYYGSQVAAPVFSRIASYAVRKEGVAPMVLKEASLLPQINQLKGRADLNTSQAFKNLNQKLLVDLMSYPKDRVPRLENLTAREVLRAFSGQSVQIKFRGEGVVSQTIPKEGELWDPQKTLTVLLKPTANN